MCDSGTSQVTLCVNSVGQLYVTRGTSSGSLVSGQVAPLATSVNALQTNVWYFLEFMSVINSTTGSATVRVNGVNWINVSSVNTQNSANSTANTIQIGFDSGSIPSIPNVILVDDLYICDSTGTKNNTFLGDCRVETLYPNGAGANTNWTPKSGANYTNVNEAQFDGDTSYVSSCTVNQVDTYTMNSLPTTPVKIFGIQQTFAVSKSDAGNRSASGQILSGGSTTANSAAGVPNSYLFMRNIAELDPATGVSWVASGVNSVQTGIKLVS